MSAARSKKSAGIVLYRHRRGILEIFLVHPGGPYWANKDRGAWSIPKGEYQDGEQPLQAAQREFLEETGVAISGPFLPLAPVRQASGKVITAWAIEGDLDPTKLRSNHFVMQWPPKSGVMQSFPEVDRGAWLSVPECQAKLLAGQRPLLEQLVELVTVDAALQSSPRRPKKV